MVVDLDKVKARIRAMLNTAADDAATEGEIDNALRFARAMMQQHHLEESDLAEEPADQYEDIARAPKGTAAAVVGKKLFAWEGWLAHFCSKFVGGVGHYLDSDIQIARRGRLAVWDENGEVRMGKAVVFYGVAEDALLAKELYDDLRTTIITMARLTWGGCYQGDGGAYAEGFVEGLNTKLRKAAEQERLEAAGNGRALILIDRREDLIERKTELAKSWLANERGIKLRRGTGRSGANGSRQARSEGRADGAAAQVGVSRTKKITS